MKTLEIASKDNPTYKKLKTLLTSKGIKTEKSFFLMGEKLIAEFLKKNNSAFKIKNVICFEDSHLPVIPTQIKLKKDLFNELDVLGTHYPLLQLEYNDLHEFHFQESPQGLEIICPLGDPKNLGSLARSALAFGASKMILTHESCHPYLPQSIKSSAGAILDLTIFMTPLPIKEINLTGECYGLDLNGIEIQKVQWPKNLRLFVGEEGPGLNLSPEQRKKMKMIQIPTKAVESLNASTSVSIALWEWSKNV